MKKQCEGCEARESCRQAFGIFWKEKSGGGQGCDMPMKAWPEGWKDRAVAGAGRDGRQIGYGFAGAGRDGRQIGNWFAGAERDGRQIGYGLAGAGRDGRQGGGLAAAKRAAARNKLPWQAEF